MYMYYITMGKELYKFTFSKQMLQKFQGVRFYNDSVYGKTSDGIQYKFDIFDNISELKQKGRKNYPFITFSITYMF